VWLKNRVDRSYFINHEYPKPDQIPIELVDREALKQGLFQLVVSAPSRAIRVQVADCIKLIAIRDFGTEWPDYLDHAVALLSSKDPREVYAGLIVTLGPVKAFRYRTDSQNMIVILQRTLPLLLQIGEHLLENPSTPEAAEYLHLVFKIYKNSILNELLPTHSAADSILSWGKLLLGMAAMQVPNVELDEDERERSEAWKAKKWAFSSLNILFTRLVVFLALLQSV
jgi:importin-7